MILLKIIIVLKYSFYMKDIWCTNVQYYIDLYLWKDLAVIPWIVRKTIDILLSIGICWTIFRHAYAMDS